MYKVLIVWATSWELKTIIKKIKELNFNNVKFDYLITWMWNYSSIFSLTKYLSKNNDIDFVINIWVCWYKNKYEKNFQVWRIKNLANKKELIIPNFINFWKIESIASSENIVYDNQIIWEENFVDMESFWIEYVLEKINIARILLKIPVDKIWDETKNFDFEKAKKYLEENIDYKTLIEKIINYLEKNKKDINNAYKYFEILNLTESQKIIFERLYNKYNVLVWEDFDEYLNNFLEKFNNDKKTQKNDIKKFLNELDLFLEDK